jgi:putative endonuclease
LYVGVTANVVARIRQHLEARVPGFTRKYTVNKLVWFEAHGRAGSAITREKQIKGWLRARKTALIEAANPHWKDLSAQLR